MSISVKSYYGYPEAKLGYVNGDKTQMVVCHNHQDPYKSLSILNPAQFPFFGTKTVASFPTEELMSWKKSLEECIQALDTDLQSKLERGDDNYREASRQGCTDDGVILRTIQQELNRRKKADEEKPYCVDCYQLARRITQIEYENQELVEMVNKLNKKKRCCSLF